MGNISPRLVGSMRNIAYADFLQHWYQKSGPKIRLGLGTIGSLLTYADLPQQKMANVVVAGTNGKGSTTELIASTLALAGYKTGIYTSPHLLRFSERIRINGVEISPEQVIKLGTRLLDIADKHQLQPSFFELSTALAWLYFAEQDVQIAVFEVGLGGRLDATNVCDKALSVITPIDLDHQAILGSTLKQIALEKAGIMQTQRPVVVAPQTPEVRAIIEREADNKHALLYWSEPGVCDQVIASFMKKAPIAWYQKVNFQTAQRALDRLALQGFDVSTATRLQAMQNFTWPGRFQWLMPEDLFHTQAFGPILLDGGHNPAGARALVQALCQDTRSHKQPCHVIFSAVEGKDMQTTCQILKPYVTSWRVCANRSARTLKPAHLAAAIGLNTGIYDGFEQAFEDACDAQARMGGIILIFGSLFLVGEALAYLTGSPQDPAVDG